MMILASSAEGIFIKLSGPQPDLTIYPVYVAIVPEESGEPATGDYLPGVWIDGEASYTPTAGQFPAGFYMVYARVVAPPEDVRLRAGRLRVGDPL